MKDSQCVVPLATAGLVLALANLLETSGFGSAIYLNYLLNRLVK